MELSSRTTPSRSIAAGDVDLARYELDSVAVPTNSPESMQVGMRLPCSMLWAILASNQ